jgi:hypothetical protein
LDEVILKAEIYSGVIFNPANCHKQCRKMQTAFLGGNELMYRQGLIARYGLEYTESIEKFSKRNKTTQYTKQELIAKKLQSILLIKNMK